MIGLPIENEILPSMFEHEINKPLQVAFKGAEGQRGHLVPQLLERGIKGGRREVRHQQIEF